MEWIQLAQESNNRVLWRWYWTYRFNKRQWISWPAEWQLLKMDSI